MKKKLNLINIILVIISISCNIDGYHDIGTFSDRITAENKALEYLFVKYNRLPDNGYYKVSYSYLKNGINQDNSIWYDRKRKYLAVENDILSGYCCAWKGVNKYILNQIVLAKKGVFLADSLAIPDPIGYRGDF
jgi:hypothetical protein